MRNKKNCNGEIRAFLFSLANPAAMCSGERELILTTSKRPPPHNSSTSVHGRGANPTARLRG